MKFEIRDPHYDERVRASFARQRAMQTLGVSIRRLAPGEIELEMPYDLAYIAAGAVEGGRHDAGMHEAVLLRHPLIGTSKSPH